jgi:hypothetical protein
MKIFRNRPIRNKHCLWWPCLSTDQNEMTDSYRGPSIDASYQVAVHLVKQFQRRKFLEFDTIRIKNCLCRPCLLWDGDEMSNLYRGPSKDASYQVSVYLAKRFQRRRLKCEKLADDRPRTTDAKWWQKFTLPLARWAKKNFIGLII